MRTEYRHVADAYEYARDVVDGRVPACKWVIRACERHLTELEAAKTRSFPYRFDEARAEDICRFIELFKHVKGKWARRREHIRLERWQKFILTCIWGWVRKKDNLRRFREAYVEVPRKNGKSTIAAGSGLYMLAADGEVGAEVYCGATSEKQALEVFRPAKQMAQESIDFREAFGVEVAAKRIWIPSDLSRFEPVIGKPGDGASPHYAIVDEFHEHPDDSLVDTMRTGMGAREQPLLFIITTAGSDIEGPCGAMNLRVRRMLDGIDKDPELFGIIYTIDDDDDWTTEEAIRKANPNADVSVSVEFIRSQVQQALLNPRKQAVVKTKHFNIWVHSRSQWIALEAWRACADESLRLEDFAGEPCMIGIDLASKIDIASMVAVFYRDGEYYIFDRHYVPEERVFEVDDPRYEGWVASGHIIATPGNITDFEYIEQDLLKWCSEFEVKQVAYDPHQAHQFATRMQHEGVPMVEVRQNTSNLSPAMKEFEALLLARRIHHANSPVLTWMFSNVVVKPNAKGEIYPRKEREKDKIDGAVATLLAINRWLAHDPEEDRSVYEEQDLLVL